MHGNDLACRFSGWRWMEPPRFSGDSRIIESACGVGMTNKGLLTEGDAFVKLPGVDVARLVSFLESPGEYQGLNILGEPGAGKSTLALRVVTELERKGYPVFKFENSREPDGPLLDRGKLREFGDRVDALAEKHPGRPVFLCVDELQYALYRNWKKNEDVDRSFITDLRGMLARYPQVRLVSTGLSEGPVLGWFSQVNMPRNLADEYCRFIQSMPVVNLNRLEVSPKSELAGRLMASVDQVLQKAGFKPMPEDFQRRILGENPYLNPRMLLYFISHGIRNAWPGRTGESSADNVEEIPRQVWEDVAETYRAEAG